MHSRRFAAVLAACTAIAFLPDGLLAATPSAPAAVVNKAVFHGRCAGAGCVPASNTTLVISNHPTRHVMCSSGTCSATGLNAVLNAADLQALLASGSVQVTTGTLGNGVLDIQVAARLRWTSDATLGLSAAESVYIDQSMSVMGSGGLEFDYANDQESGDLVLGLKVTVDFASTASAVKIQSGTYTLEDDMATMANDINANPKGNYALIKDIAGGRWTASPVKALGGTFEGFGHTIKRLMLKTHREPNTGLFAVVNQHAAVRDLGLDGGTITAAANGSTMNIVVNVGSLVGLVAQNGGGAVIDCWSSASVDASGVVDGNVGGLVGSIGNTRSYVTASYATGSVIGGITVYGYSIGGLAGYDAGTIAFSHATGSVSVANTGNPVSDVVYAVGGLVGNSDPGGSGNGLALITMSYETGAVNVNGPNAFVGGLTATFEGVNTGYTIDHTYATGNVTLTTASPNELVGGLLARDDDWSRNSGNWVGNSYAAGVVSGPSNDGCSDLYTGDCVGGFLGWTNDYGCCNGDAWDTDPKGEAQGLGGTGNIDVAGIVGMEDSVLRCTSDTCTLPPGFDSAWGTDPNTNSGLPYLLANPPS